VIPRVPIAHGLGDPSEKFPLSRYAARGADPMERIGSILVATDLSAASDAALVHAARLSKDTGADLRVVHVASSETLEVLGTVMPETRDVSESYFRTKATEELESRLSTMDLAKRPAIEVRFGKPHKEIISGVEEHKADLLVLGATGLTGRRMGTVAGRCVRSSPVSVLLIPEKRGDRFGSIVACVDFSEGSEETLRQASILAEHERARLGALYVYHLPDMSPMHTSSAEQLSDALTQFPSVMSSRFEEQLKHAARGADVSLALIEHIDYTKGILGYVQRENIDCVAVGTTKRTKLGYFIMGTTAEKVIRDSDGAVLAVR
jgi:nucleotide-binding universal stress UspA family protein